MTLHAAKGLEFPVVAVAGMEEGLFPLSRAETAEEIEEERRLAYVGITRARNKLFLSHAGARRRNGQLMMSSPSRFLADVPPSLVEERVTRPSWGVAREPAYRPKPRQYSQPAFAAEVADAMPDEQNDDAPLYVKGERVKHRRFGTGTIATVAGRGRDLKVEVAFDDESVGSKLLMAAYAGLERALE
jgi:DNA helicase-2/ATP-dependent DNA helicase PcrA